MSDTAESSTLKQIAELWQRNQPLILERLAQLDDAAAAASTSQLSEELRAGAESTAHKLSGTLGMFGYHEGTLHARELETELRTEAPDPGRLTQLATALRNSLYPPSV